MASLEYLLIEKLNQLGNSARFQGYHAKMATAPIVFWTHYNAGLLIVGKINFGQNCPLIQYLEEQSMEAGGSLKTQFASALLFGLGYPQYTQPPDSTFTTHLLQSIRENGQNDLLSEAIEKCGTCFQSDSCKVAAVFKNV